MINFVDFVGAGCQYELDACREGMCQNGATCELLGGGNYRCVCQPGFEIFSNYWKVCIQYW